MQLIVKKGVFKGANRGWVNWVWAAADFLWPAHHSRGATGLVHTIVGLSCHQTSAHYCLSAIRLVCTIVALSFLQSSVGHHHLSQNWRVPRYERIALYQRSNADSWMERDPTTTTLAIAVTTSPPPLSSISQYWPIVLASTVKEYCIDYNEKILYGELP